VKTRRTLAVLLLLGGAVFLYTSRERKHREEIDQLRQQAVALRTSLDEGEMRASFRFAALSNRPDPQRSDVQPERLASASASGSGAAGAPTPPVEPHRPLEPTEISKHMDAALSREVADRQWSPGATEAIQKGTGGLIPPGAEVGSVDCRTSFCRVEIRYKDQADYRAFTLNAYVHGTTRFWSGPTLTVLVSDAQGGPAVAVSYLAREGHELPSLPE
jgi:hypothetical protein